MSGWFERRIPERFVSVEDRVRGALVIAICWLGAPILAAVVALSLAVGAPQVFVGLAGAALVAAVAIPLLLRWVSLHGVGAAMLIAATAITTGMSIAHGGYAIHIMLWTALIPVATLETTWRPLFRIAAVVVVAQNLALFAADLGGLFAPVVVHARTVDVGLSFASLLGVSTVLIAISWHSSRVIRAHAGERRRYQRALLQAQKLNLLGQVSGTMVHDFNNVLMSMDYAVHALGNSRVRESREIVELEGAVDRAKDLSRRLEQFESGAAAPVEVDIDDAIGRLETVCQRIGGRAIDVELDLSAAGAAICIEPCQLDQLVLNLVVNAADAMPDGGAITIATTATGDRVVLSVCDTGTGIEPEVAARIFDPFFTTKGADEGSGLGLWSCRSIARDAGGDIAVVSEPGRGARFVVELPLAGAAAGDVPPETETEAAPIDLAAPRRPAPRWARWFVEGIRDRRERAWGRFLCRLAAVAAVLWQVFALSYWLRFSAGEVALAMSAAGLLTAATPLVLRLSASFYAAASYTAAVSLGGLAAIAVGRGGFPLVALAWVLVIPQVAALQKESRLFAPLWTAACLAYVAGFFALAISGHAAGPSVVLSGFDARLDELVVVLGVGFVLCLVGVANRGIDRQITAERDAFRRALVGSQKLEALGTYASVIAHDLNNVLLRLEFASTLLARELPDGHAAHRDLEALDRGCQRVRSLSRQLVRFGRNDDGPAASVRVDSAIAELEGMLAPLLGSRVEIRCDLEAGAAAVDIAPKRLDLVLVNLMLNARDAMVDGGVVEVRSRREGEGVVVEIADAGDGIAGEILDRVFEPFFTTRADQGKRGLGLWVCKSIVDDAGGRLDADSSGAGTTMRLHLPLARQTRRPR